MDCLDTRHPPRVVHLSPVPMRIVAISKGLGQGPENSKTRAVRDGAYCSRPTIPLLDSVPLHLRHVVRLDPDPTNRPINNLLPPRTKVQVLVLSL